VLKRTLRYLKATISLGLVFGAQLCNTPFQLEGWCDADFGGDIKDRKSTSGYIFKLGGSCISWSSKKQPTVALSSTEAEYLATTQAAKEAIWLHRLLSQLGHKQALPIIINEDNQSCIALSRNPVFHSRTKHLDVQAHFIRDQTTKGTVALEHCPTKLMIADFLTKPISKKQLEKLNKLAGILDIKC